MNLKRFATLGLTVAMALSLAACGSESTPASSTAASSAAASSTAASSTAASSAASKTYDWPKQPVNMMCPAAAGGGTDLILRLENEYFTKLTGQTFVITNQTGITGYEQTHQANTDGYDFICGTTTIFTSKLDGTLDYDWTDYEMVAFVAGDYTTCIAVRADSKYQTINELLDAAKADRTSVTGGITMSGQPYMFAKALAAQTGIDLYYVDTGNTSERNAALLGGQVDYIITNGSAAAAYIDSGDFRVLAIDGEERNPQFADIPTFKESGIDFCFVPQPTVYLAPKGTPAEACEAFNYYLNEIFTDPAYAEDFLNNFKGIAKPVPSVEESKVLAQQFADTLAPYVG